MSLLKKLPDTLVIIFIIMAGVTLLTWLVPSGEYERMIVKGREIIDPDSFSYTSGNPQNIFDLFKAPIEGFQSAAQIIAFILIIGGAFHLLNKTGAVNQALNALVRFSKKRPAARRLIVPTLVCLFSVAGATFGMSEEVLVFILITIPLAHSLGYDTLLGIAIPFVGAGAGFAGAFANPFTIGIAQGIADLPPFSGWEYRLLVWAVLTLCAAAFMSVYAYRLEKQKVVGFYNKKAAEQAQMSDEKLSRSHKLILLIFGLTLLMLVYGINEFDWYINEIAALFLMMGIAAGIISHLSLSEMVAALTEGAKDMVVAGLVIALSKGILILASDGKIIDTILYAVAGLANNLPKAISVQVMFFVQCFINFFIPSGSGQAALTMPIMAPLSDLLGISRQTAVLAYQFGDGLSNMIIPTSGVTMGVLSIAKVPYERWLRWMAPLFAIFMIAAMILLLLPVLVFEYGPF
jgi:uncharacterized ion transporter superfamily protein YfcC